MQHRHYLPEIDYLRGWAILGVLAIHVSSQVVKSGGGQTDTAVAMALNLVSRFSVPAFVFLSALLAARGLAADPGGSPYYSSLLRKLRGIVVPYVVWTVLSLGLNWVLGLISWQSVAVTLFLGGGTLFHLYFIPLVFQYYALAPWMYRLLNTTGRTKWLVLFVGLNLVYLLFCQVVFSGGLELPEPWRGALSKLVHPTFPAWFGYYVLGFACGQHYSRFRERVASLARKIPFLFFIVSLSLLFIDVTLTLSLSPLRPGQVLDFVFMRLSVFVYACAAILLILHRATRIQDGIGFRLFSLIGQYSFGIYLVHLFVQLILQRVADSLFRGWTGGVAAFLVVVGISLGTVMVFEKWPGGWLLVGFSTRRKLVSRSERAAS